MAAAGKVRVYDLARDLGLSNKELMTIMEREGYAVKSHSSSLDEEVASMLRDLVIAERTAAKKKPAVEPAKSAPAAARACTSAPRTRLKSSPFDSFRQQRRRGKGHAEEKCFGDRGGRDRAGRACGGSRPVGGAFDVRLDELAVEEMDESARDGGRGVPRRGRVPL